MVGAGNSVGQAAVYLAGQARKVYLAVRGDDLYRSMSNYLGWRIERTPNIEILFNTTVRRMSGDGHLASIEIVSSKTGEVRTIETPALFSFIGAAPRTAWLPAEIERNGQDFVRTGAALAQSPSWTAPRQPFVLETGHPGVFAAGLRSPAPFFALSHPHLESDHPPSGPQASSFTHTYLK